MHVLLTGAQGQLGQALIRTKPSWVRLQPLSRIDLDLTRSDSCQDVVARYKPDWLINAAAYTHVDRAEHESDLAFQINAKAPALMAAAMAACGGRFLQISTDFVFNGRQGFPYLSDHPVDPLGVYGCSKAEGERAVLSAGFPVGAVHVLRTSWLYGPVGHNFFQTMLRLHAERQQIGVVADQVGCPTATHTLAQACWRVVERSATHQLPEILHWCDAGVASWYDFAMAIGEMAYASGLLTSRAQIKALRTCEYPTEAERPSYSLLDCSSTRAQLGLEAVHWRQALQDVVGHSLEHHHHSL